MEDGLDSPLDLGFVNYKRHPSDSRYMVFRFKEADMADFFRAELVKQNLWFEEGAETLSNGKNVVLFGVHNTDYKKVQRINFQTSAKFKPRFISNKPLRYFLLGFFFLFLLFAIFGIIKVNFIN